jgi:hypothetical protein
VHFIGFLANVDDAITGLQIGDGFTVESRSASDVAPFLEKIDLHYGRRASLEASSGGCYCVLGSGIAEFETTPQGGVVIRPDVLQNAHSRVQHTCRLLRLFKEGNILLAQSFLYHVVDDEPKSFSFIRQYPILDRSLFTLSPDEAPAAEQFLRDVVIPFAKPSLQLAFESFEQSYEVENQGLAFLSLMIAMEVLLNPSDRELRYRVSRNSAVLLGQTREMARGIFQEIKTLYDKRSKLVHTGNNSLTSRADVLKLRDYVRKAIKEIYRVNRSRDELLAMLNTCGFGQRPWRDSSMSS